VRAQITNRGPQPGVSSSVRQRRRKSKRSEDVFLRQRDIGGVLERAADLQIRSALALAASFSSQVARQGRMLSLMSEPGYRNAAKKQPDRHQ
jgi:hypothetical protein